MPMHKDQALPCNQRKALTIFSPRCQYRGSLIGWAKFGKDYLKTRVWHKRIPLVTYPLDRTHPSTAISLPGIWFPSYYYKLQTKHDRIWRWHHWEVISQECSPRKLNLCPYKIFLYHRRMQGGMNRSELGSILSTGSVGTWSLIPSL